MPFKPWVRNISPLAWLLGASAGANFITMLAVLYIAFGVPKVIVDNGYVRVRGSVRVDDDSAVRVRVDGAVRVDGSLDINDRVPLRVQVAR
jgi:hypothetical protein